MDLVHAPFLAAGASSLVARITFSQRRDARVRALRAASARGAVRNDGRAEMTCVAQQCLRRAVWQFRKVANRAAGKAEARCSATRPGRAATRAAQRSTRPGRAAARAAQRSTRATERTPRIRRATTRSSCAIAVGSGARAVTLEVTKQDVGRATVHVVRGVAARHEAVQAAADTTTGGCTGAVRPTACHLGRGRPARTGGPAELRVTEIDAPTATGERTRTDQRSASEVAMGMPQPARSRGALHGPSFAVLEQAALTRAS